LLLLPPQVGGGPLGDGVGVELAAAGSQLDEPANAPVVGEAIDGAGAVIVVDVVGAVMRPGLVQLHLGDRVGEAIQAAGGFSPRVDLAATGHSLNLADRLDDGAKVVVPELGTHTPAVARAEDARVDLNHADQAALEALPGIGPVTAARIIEARKEQPFASVDELRAREVVGEALFEDIRDLVRVSG
jgi:competence protein ComEA